MDYYIDFGGLTRSDNEYLEAIAPKVTEGRDGKVLWFGDRPVHYNVGSHKESARIFFSQDSLKLVPIMILRMRNKMTGGVMPEEVLMRESNE